MVSVAKKIISGRKFFYLVKSVRLPDGKAKNLYKFLGSKKPKNIPRAEDYFQKKEQEANSNWAVKKYSKDKIITDSEIRKIEAMRLGYKNILKKLTEKQRRDLFDRFTVNFTYESNAIEGSSLTLKDVAIIIFENATIKGKGLREIYEARNSREVVDMVLRKKFNISHESIIKMHKILVKDIDTAIGYKKIPNFILGKNLETAPPEKVHEEMEKLINWYHGNKEKIHPLPLAAVFHGRFEKIHPFDDGNGRVGRFLINAILINSGYPPLIIRRTVRTAYMSCLSAFDNGHHDNLKRFLLEKFKDTYRKFFEIYVKYV